MTDGIRPDRVAIYIRWSTDDQGDGTTLEVQQEACEHYVRSQGWAANPRLVYVDDGFSGGNLRRPALNLLRQAVREGAVDCVIVFKLDRLSRSVVDTVNLVLAEWEGRCYLKSAREPIDTGTPAGKMFFYLLASYAEWERSVIRDRTHAGRVQRAAQGKWAAGPPPFGFRIGPGKSLVVEPAEAAVVRRIYAEYLRGRTVGDLVRLLRDDAAPAPAGPGQWTRAGVRRVLGNPVYTGVLEYGRLRVNPRHGRDPGAGRLVPAESPHVRVPGAVPALISDAAFAAVQQARQERDMRRNRRSGRAYSSRWLLSAIARCARCGSGLAARGPRNGRKAFYYCPGRTSHLACDCAQIQVAELDAWLVAELKRVYGDAVRRRRLLEDLAAGREQRRAELAAGLSGLRTQLAQLDRERATVRRRFRADEISGAELHEFLAEIDRDTAGLEERLTALDQELAALDRATTADELVADLAAVDVCDSLDPLDRKRLILRLVRSLRVYRGPGARDIDATVEWRLAVDSPAGEAAPPPADAGGGAG